MAARSSSNVFVTGVAILVLTAPWLVPGPRRDAAVAAEIPDRSGRIDGGADGLLAETVGLHLHLALLADDRARFEEQATVVEQVLLAPCGLLSWRVDPGSGMPARASASVDDLKVIRALLAGAERWGVLAWSDLAHSIGDAALRLETVDGMLVEGATWEHGDVVASRAVETAYLDLATLGALAEREPRWSIVYSNALELLLESQTTLGLFPRRVTPEGGAIADSNDEVNAIHVLYCAIHLAEVERGGDRTLAFFIQQLDRDGMLEGRFQLATGAPLPGYEDLAVYALTARLALILDQREAARRLLEPVREGRLQQLDDVPFDNLQASVALAEERLARGTGSKQED